MNIISPRDLTLPSLPEDVEVEQAVIGICIARNDMIASIETACSADDFYHAPHPKIMEAIFALHREQQPVTPLTLRSSLDGEPGLIEMGGHEYLATLALASPTENPIHLARIVRDLRQRRDALIALWDAQSAIPNRTIPVLTALKPALDAADRAASIAGARTIVSFHEAAQSLLAKAESVARGTPTQRISTGLETLDGVLGGLQAGDLCVYAGRPGMGKSSLLLTTALAAAMAGRPTLFFSLEMTQEALMQRIGCDMDFYSHSHEPLSYSWFRDGKARMEQVGRLAEALAQVPDNLVIYENADLTIHEIAALSRAHASRTQQMGVVLIDYLQKIRASDRYAGNKVQEVTEISNAAKALAMRLKWPVVVGAQLNRGVESRSEQRPALSDLRESGAIEQDADSVVGLYRPGYYIDKRKPGLKSDARYGEWESEHEENKNRLDLIVLKNRHGAEDTLSVRCDMRASAIRDARPDPRFGRI